MDTAEQRYFPDRTSWRAWLTKHHESDYAIWVIYDKGGKGLTYEQIVLEALCFGWIDSRPGKIDEARTKLYICKRKPKSVWSKTNKERVALLTEQELIKPAGQQAIDIAKQNGAWDTLNKSDNLEMPAELANLFSQQPHALANYEAFPVSSKRMILEWIYAAKTDTTRMKRINETVELAEQNIRAHHQSTT